MLTESHGVSRDDSMSMVCGCNDDSVDGLVHLIIHLAVVPISFCVRELVEYALGVIPVDVAKSNNVLGVFHCIDIGMSHTADTNNGNIQFI